MSSQDSGSAPTTREKPSTSEVSKKDDTKVKETKSFAQKVKGLVPDYAKEGVKSPRAWKNFARCMIATFCTLVLLVDNKCMSNFIY